MTNLEIKSHNTNSTYEQIDKQLQTLTKILWCMAGASFVIMCLSIAVAVIVILTR